MDNCRYYTMEGGGKSIEIRYYFEKYRAACYIMGLVVLSGVIWSKRNVKRMQNGLWAFLSKRKKSPHPFLQQGEEKLWG